MLARTDSTAKEKLGIIVPHTCIYSSSGTYLRWPSPLSFCAHESQGQQGDQTSQS